MAIVASRVPASSSLLAFTETGIVIEIPREQFQELRAQEQLVQAKLSTIDHGRVDGIDINCVGPGRQDERQPATA